MKTKILFTTLFATLTFCYTTAQNFQFAKAMGGTDDDFGYSITKDANGNVFTTGFFRGAVDFDPGPSVFNLVSAGNRDIFISKLDSAGNFKWAKSMGGTSSDVAYSIALDANGNIFTTGYFGGTADFDPGASTSNLTSAGGQDIFISKLDSSGYFAWAIKMGGINNDYAYSLSLDNNSQVSITGAFHGIADFDPSANTTNLSSFGGTADIFVSKYDASGNLLWTKSMGGSIADVGWAITTDMNGNIYTTGQFEDTVDFDPGTGVSNLIITTTHPDIFVSKLDPLGNFVWAKQLGGSDSDYPYSITTDATGNVLTTGYFIDTADFDPGASVFNLTSSPGNANVFVSKLNSSGDFVWAKSMGGLGSDIGKCISTDVNDNVITTGYFTNTADFDPAVGVFNLTSAGDKDVFVSKYDHSGNFMWAIQLGGIGEDIGNSITTEGNGNIYTTGNFNNTSDFDPATGIFNLTSVGDNDIFIHKLGTSTVGIAENVKWNMLSIYPNPTLEILNIILSEKKKTQVQIINEAGVLVREMVINQSAQINISDLGSGLYFVHMKQDDKTIETKKLIITD